MPNKPTAEKRVRLRSVVAISSRLAIEARPYHCHQLGGSSVDDVSQRLKLTNVKAPANMPKKPLLNSQTPIIPPTVMLASGPRIQSTNILMATLLEA
jgi:hypothetical protein